VGWVWENIADRHSICADGGYRIHQVPSKPGRGIFHFPDILLRVCHILNYLLWHPYFFLKYALGCFSVLARVQLGQK